MDALCECKATNRRRLRNIYLVVFLLCSSAKARSSFGKRIMLSFQVRVWRAFAGNPASQQMSSSHVRRRHARRPRRSSCRRYEFPFHCVLFPEVIKHQVAGTFLVTKSSHHSFAGEVHRSSSSRWRSMPKRFSTRGSSSARASGCSSRRRSQVFDGMPTGFWRKYASISSGFDLYEISDL